MKQSYYNVLARTRHGSILYNTANQAMVELDESETACLEGLEHCQDAALLDELAAEGFILDDPELQADCFCYDHNRYAQDNTLFDLTITLSWDCNFACPYCYVTKRDDYMPPAIQDKVVEFVAYNYTQAPFKELRINWYGGEPLLAIGEMERLSGMLMAFCAEHGIVYMGHILTNASLADATMAKRLAENCGIVSVMPTMSGGTSADQDTQRPAKDGKPRFDIVLENLDHLIDAGIIVHLNYVTSHNCAKSCSELACQLVGKPGMVTRLSRAQPFYKDHIYLEDDEGSELRLFDDEEYARYYRRFFAKQGLDSEGYRGLLKPKQLFCSAWSARGFFVDDRGCVTKCMVDMDFPETRTLFNLAEWSGAEIEMDMKPYVDYLKHNPMTNEKCRRCRVYPLCRGGCARPWAFGARSRCSELAFLDLCIEGLVLDYHDAIMREKGDVL